jgi:membrane protein
VVSWIVASVGFSFYLANFADYGATYGSMGAAIGLLLYLYITAFVVLLPGRSTPPSLVPKRSKT